MCIQGKVRTACTPLRRVGSNITPLTVQITLHHVFCTTFTVLKSPYYGISYYSCNKVKHIFRELHLSRYTVWAIH